MSYPQIIVSAVAELSDDTDYKELWEHFDFICDETELFPPECSSEDTYHASTGYIKGYKVETRHHIHRKEKVLEVVIEQTGEKIKSLSVSGLEDDYEKIQSIFPMFDFTLESYYWYNGTDRPGGCGGGDDL